MQSIARLVSGHFHYGWVVAGVLFAVLLTVAGVRSTASVLIVPLEQAFGWSRATISGALSICLFLYGLMGPFAGAIALRIGIRKTIMLAVSLLSATVGASTAMTEPWQFYLTWGVFVGLGSGSVALVMGAIVASRWFVSSRGLVMGILSASTATGQLVFLPSLAALATQSGWQPVAWVIALALACLLPLVWGLVPERPEDVGLTANGAGPAAATAPARNPILVAFDALAIGARSREFWLLAGSFFICGLSTNGLVGTHLIAACFDHGIPEVQAAGLLALIGIFDLIGTTLSGWLSDRYDNRWLLFWYYGLRGLSLMFLPYSGFTIVGLTIFAVFYGLDWIATVPPTMRLTATIFGKEVGPIMFGWLMVSHQLGSAVAASGAGLLRTSLERYVEAFMIAGIACVLASLLVLRIGRHMRPPRPQSAAA